MAVASWVAQLKSAVPLANDLILSQVRNKSRKERNREELEKDIRGKDIIDMEMEKDRYID